MKYLLIGGPADGTTQEFTEPPPPFCLAYKLPKYSPRRFDDSEWAENMTIKQYRYRLEGIREENAIKPTVLFYVYEKLTTREALESLLINYRGGVKAVANRDGSARELADKGKTAKPTS